MVNQKETPPAGARDAVADAAESLRGLAGVIRKHGTCAPAALEVIAARLGSLTDKVDGMAEHCHQAGCQMLYGGCAQVTQPAATGAVDSDGSLIAHMDAIMDAYSSWPADIRKKLSLHDLRRMTGWKPNTAAPGMGDAADVDRLARDLFAAEYERDGIEFLPGEIRKPNSMLTMFEDRAIRAIKAALAAQPAPVDGMCYCQEGVVCPTCERAQPAPVVGGVGYGIIDPDYARIFTVARVLCWSEGYALTMHGSFTRDLDLVAVPWIDRAREPEHLARRILETCGLKDTAGNPGEKSHGRLVWTMRLPDFGDPRFVDFSVMPPSPLLSARPGGEGEWPSGKLSRNKTIEVLRSHNEWRRGADAPQTDPRILGFALDAAIAALSSGAEG